MDYYRLRPFFLFQSGFLGAVGLLLLFIAKMLLGDDFIAWFRVVPAGH